MSRHAQLALIVVAAALAVPSAAAAASYVADGSNTCLSSDLTVTSALSTPPGSAGDTVTATVTALGAPGQRVSRLHLDLEVQERTATAWVPFLTPGHAETYAKAPGTRIHRTWTLREDAGPIDALLEGHVQMRVYARFRGSCRGQSFGPPLLFALTVPSLANPSA
jgi:hypothetical protein